MAKKPDKRDKRGPTLADRVLARTLSAHEKIIHPKTYDQLMQGVRSAHRFVFDEEAARRVAQVVLDIPSLLVREHGFARAPFEVTWIEYPSYAYWNRLHDADPERYTGQGEWGDKSTADHTVGYLIDHNRINTFVGGTVTEPDLLPDITPMQYRLRTEWDVNDQIEFARLVGCSRMMLDMIMWGSTYDVLSDDERRLLRAYNVMEQTPLNPSHRTYHTLTADAGMGAAARGSVGDMRTIIALLLMLNRPSLTTYKQTLPNSHGFIRGKYRAYLNHTTVTIAIDPVPTLRLVGTPAGDAVARRRHEVRGHYAHNREARDYAKIAGCIHNFEPNHGPPKWLPWPDAGPDDPDNWVCSECGGKRWWIPEHERGDESLGYVIHDEYNVVRRHKY
jgi:hypothetical protein